MPMYLEKFGLVKCIRENLQKVCINKILWNSLINTSAVGLKEKNVQKGGRNVIPVNGLSMTLMKSIESTKAVLLIYQSILG